MKEYIGNCIVNPFNSMVILETIIDDANEITKKEFLENCVVLYDIEIDMEEYLNDYGFYEYEDICFYTHSAIEYFYKEV